MSNANVLPDSRLRDPKGCVMADWQMLDDLGQPATVRLELEPIYCFNCGCANGYVPRDTMSFVSWLCLPCSVKYGEQASSWSSSDREFWDKVGAEMQARFGRALTQQELWQLAEQDRLGTGLNLLARESPFRGGVQ